MLICLCIRLLTAPAMFRLLFSYEILTPAALNFFVDYADGAVESLWSIDQYFEFVLVLMLSTGLSFQVMIQSLGLEIVSFRVVSLLSAHISPDEEPRRGSEGGKRKIKSHNYK